MCFQSILLIIVKKRSGRVTKFEPFPLIGSLKYISATSLIIHANVETVYTGSKTPITRTNSSMFNVVESLLFVRVIVDVAKTRYVRDAMRSDKDYRQGHDWRYQTRYPDLSAQLLYV
jgi:hypothetical protein